MSHQDSLFYEQRRQNKKNIDSFIRSILNLDIIDMFKNQPFFEKIPDDFPQGHRQYLRVWEKLFMYETYNIIVNSKRSEEKVSTQFEQQRRLQKSLSWVGYLIKSNEDINFVNARLYDKKPSLALDKNKRPRPGADDSKEKSNQQESDEFSPLRGIKESDILIISTVDLIAQSKQRVDDIKKLITPEWLKVNLLVSNSMFAYVSQRSQKGATFLEVKLDISKSSFLRRMQDQDNGYLKVFCYQVESLSTTIREYKTLRMSEFYGLTDTILMPKTALQLIQKSCEYHKNAIQMQQFVKQFGGKFNPSQREALVEVTKMVDDQLLLIQGPVTWNREDSYYITLLIIFIIHTITGIISMLIRSGVEKILVCAPSNAAVDEIITRINQRGLVGLDLKKDDIVEMMVRIGSMDYEPSPQVKPHTLDQRLILTLNSQMLHDNKVKINYCEEILDLLKKNIQLSVEDKNHKIYLQSLVGQNLKKLKDFFKKYPTTFDQKKFFLNIKERLMAQNSKIKQNMEENRQSQGGDWRYVENQIILKSKILCSTLSMAGVEKFDIVKDQVEYLIIDEACQCIEPSTLIPFELGPARVILVGDQNQLPATTFSDNSERTKYSRSFFERLLDNGYQRYMLQIQYRMHPVIRQYPSQTFYENRITDDKTISTREIHLNIFFIFLIPPVIESIKTYFTPSVFFDLINSQETLAETSKSNNEEAQFTLNLIQLLKEISNQSKSAAQQKSSNFDFLKNKIGIITPYKSQVKILKDQIALLNINCALNIWVRLNVIFELLGCDPSAQDYKILKQILLMPIREGKKIQLSLTALEAIPQISQRTRWASWWIKGE